VDKQSEYQLVELLKRVSTAADRVLACFPNRTELSALEDLRHEMYALKAELYCEFCGADMLAHREHVGR
jgi:hypothetical protein